MTLRLMCPNQPIKLSQFHPNLVTPYAVIKPSVPTYALVSKQLSSTHRRLTGLWKNHFELEVGF